MNAKIDEIAVWQKDVASLCKKVKENLVVPKHNIVPKKVNRRAIPSMKKFPEIKFETLKIPQFELGKPTYVITAMHIKNANTQDDVTFYPKASRTIQYGGRVDVLCGGETKFALVRNNGEWVRYKPSKQLPGLFESKGEKIDESLIAKEVQKCLKIK